MPARRARARADALAPTTDGSCRVARSRATNEGGVAPSVVTSMGPMACPPRSPLNFVPR
jgi:hypothetical protein